MQTFLNIIFSGIILIFFVQAATNKEIKLFEIKKTVNWTPLLTIYSWLFWSSEKSNLMFFRFSSIGSCPRLPQVQTDHVSADRSSSLLSYCQERNEAPENVLTPWDLGQRLWGQDGKDELYSRRKKNCWKVVSSIIKSKFARIHSEI